MSDPHPAFPQPDLTDGYGLCTACRARAKRRMGITEVTIEKLWAHGSEPEDPEILRKAYYVVRRDGAQLHVYARAFWSRRVAQGYIGPDYPVGSIVWTGSQILKVMEPTC